MSFRWRPRRPISLVARLAGRRLAGGAALLALATGCLDDQPTAGPVPDGGARLALRAQITGVQAESYDVGVRVYYERAGGAQVNVPVSPTVLTVDAGTSSTESLDIEVAPCFADEARVGAPGCQLGVELSLLDETGGVLSRDTQTASLERPGVTVNVEGFNLPAAALVLDKTALTFSAVQGGGVPVAQTFTVGSNTGAELDLSVAVSSGTPTPFLSATLTTSTPEGGVVSVVPTRTDLAPGSYTANVSVSAGRTSIPLGVVAVTYTVTASGSGVIYGRVLDAATSQPLSGATVTLVPTGSTVPADQRTATTGADGSYEFGNLAGGRTYELNASAGGYIPNAAPGVQVTGAADEVLVNFSLPATSNTRRTGTLTGRVVAAATDAPISGATVLISGGTLTNGVFLTTTTDAHGNWALDAVGLDAPGGAIPSFTVSASAAGFTPAAQTLTVTQNRTTANIRFELAPAGDVTGYFTETFEGGNTWTVSGLWNRIDLANSNVVNTAYPTYVSLAPGDASNGALPDPVQGSFAFWYGNPQMGNFLGEQDPNDEPASGGNSVTENEGTLTSPSFTIPANAPAVALTFQTWFEIESVNPNQNGFDYMEVYVQVGTQTPTLLGRLNPFQDPQLTPRDMIPFTSGGFNRPPVWRPAQFDLSAYKGQTVRLLFRFSTEDAAYNGFRGWLIDDVRVTNEVVIPGVQGSRSAGGVGPVLRRSGAPRPPRRPN
jgi:hypothetical protein